MTVRFEMSPARMDLAAWLAVMLLTWAAAWLAGASGTAWLIVAPLLITGIKGQIVVDAFMRMAAAPAVWRMALRGYVWSICVIVALIHLL